MKKRISMKSAPRLYGGIVDRLKAPLPKSHASEGRHTKAPASSRQSHFLITSADRKEGRTTTTIGLAVATAAAKPQQQVLLVDLDHRRPALHKLLGGWRAPMSPGIVDVVHELVDLDDALQSTRLKNLFVLLSGNASLNVPEDCQSDNLRRLLAEIASRFDYAFYDSPALNEHVDGRLLSDLMDRVLLVVRSDRSRKDEVVAARDQIPEDKLVGAVVTDCSGPIPSFLSRYL